MIVSVVVLFLIANIYRVQCIQKVIEGEADSNLAAVDDEGRKGNPGIKVVVTANGLSHISKYAYEEFNAAFRKISIPSFSRDLPKVHWTVCKQLDLKCEILVWDTEITAIDVPSFKLNLHQPNQVGFVTSGGSLRMQGKWRKEDWSRIKKLNIDSWPWKWEWHDTVYARWPLLGPGEYTATAHGFTMHVTGNLKRNAQGLPEIVSVDCKVNIGSMDFNFNSGKASLAGFLANQIKPQLISHIKPQFEDQAKSIVLELMQPLISKVNAILRTAENLNKKLNLPDFELNYKLLEDPIVGSDYIETNLVGELKHSSNQPTPFYPPEIQTTDDRSRMVYVYASDYLLNSFLYHAHVANLTKIRVNEQENNEFAPFLRTSCPANDECLSTLFPNIASQFPNATQRYMILETTAAPRIMFKGSQAIFESSGHFELYMSPQMSNESSALPMLTLKANVDVKAKLINMRLQQGNDRTIMHSDIEEESMTINLRSVDINYKELFNVDNFVLFLTPLVELYINRELEAGVPLMLSVGQYLTNPDFTFLNRTVQIAGDMVL